MPARGTGTFVDDDGNPHEAAIEAIAAAGITLGCNPPSNDRYCPTLPVTRGEMAAFLTRAFDLPSTTTDAFTDDEGSIFESDINAVASAGITMGCGPGLYCVANPVTREQMAAFLVRALDLPPAQISNRFVDDNNSPFEANIDSLAEAGITTGCALSRFCPLDLVLRDQMATFLTRALGLLLGPSRCTLVVGFSQTREWYQGGGFEQIVPDSQWELLYEGGSSIQFWADPGFTGWSNPITSPCTTGEPDRLLLTVSGEGRPVAEWVVDIQAAAGTALVKFPSVETVILQPVVGGPNNSICQIDGEVVRASENHPVIDQAISQIAAGGVHLSGFSPEVRTCADYGDALGHLVDSAQGPIGAAIATFYLTFD